MKLFETHEVTLKTTKNEFQLAQVYLIFYTRF